MLVLTHKHTNTQTYTRVILYCLPDKTPLLYNYARHFNLPSPLLPQKSGVAIVSDAEREKTMVHELLELKSKVDGIIEKAFKNSQLFQGVVREGFEAVVNRRQNKPAELIGWCGLDFEVRSTITEPYICSALMLCDVVCKATFATFIYYM